MLVSGEKVQITFNDGTKLKGTLVCVEHGVVFLKSAKWASLAIGSEFMETLAVPLSSIKLIEIYPEK